MKIAFILIPILMCAPAIASQGSPTLRIESHLRATLGKRVSEKDFKFYEFARASIRARSATHVKEFAGQSCRFSFAYHGRGPTEFLDLMSISVDEYSYQINELRYYENGVVYIAWQHPAHAYQIPYPRLVIRVFGPDGKTAHLAFQEGFSGSEIFCYQGKWGKIGI